MCSVCMHYVHTREIALGTDVTDQTANLLTKILPFRGFDSNRILDLRGGMFMSERNFPEVLSQRILVGIVCVYIYIYI